MNAQKFAVGKLDPRNESAGTIVVVVEFRFTTYEQQADGTFKPGSSLDRRNLHIPRNRSGALCYGGTKYTTMMYRSFTSKADEYFLPRWSFLRQNGTISERDIIPYAAPKSCFFHLMSRGTISPARVR